MMAVSAKLAKATVKLALFRPITVPLASVLEILTYIITTALLYVPPIPTKMSLINAGTVLLAALHVII